MLVGLKNRSRENVRWWLQDDYVVKSHNVEDLAPVKSWKLDARTESFALCLDSCSNESAELIIVLFCVVNCGNNGVAFVFENEKDVAMICLIIEDILDDTFDCV